MSNSAEQYTSSPKRPVILSLLCIITFVATLLKFILFIWALSTSNPEYSGKSINGILLFFLGINSSLYLLVWIGITATGAAGAALMWNLKKSGFYIYSLSACVAFILPAITSGAQMMTIQRLFFTSVFIFFYGIHLKFMN